MRWNKTKKKKKIFFSSLECFLILIYIFLFFSKTEKNKIAPTVPPRHRTQRKTSNKLLLKLNNCKQFSYQDVKRTFSVSIGFLYKIAKEFNKQYKKRSTLVAVKIVWKYKTNYSLPIRYKAIFLVVWIGICWLSFVKNFPI